ncbi:MAG TPA: protein kinase, partial [Pyrinomonadaceae bacterium]|nr:protein kinase [Pyrinomonadaceae bacterium]
MTPERWNQIEEIFQAALDLPAAEREAYISEAAGADEDLREQVRALVSQHDEAGEFIEVPAVALTGVAGVKTDPHATTPDSGIFELLDDPFTGRRIGAYRVVREIGRGGMGAVYLAERADSEFRRRVAIKLIKRGMDTDFILRRFRNERQILATLDHPYIARLLDGGTTDDGLPYFVMEYIEGLPLYRFCDERKLTIPERLRLFRQVCDAVHYAHRQQVIHRDIKPSNILVTADGAPKLLDFGIAKLLNPALAADITLDPTATAMRLMTPEYASPEQVRGEPVTAASDVYSLGVLLYELLTGHRPYRLRHRAPHELARVICEEEPAHPSIVITRPDDLLPAHAPDGQTATLHYLYWSRNATVESLRRELSGDLDRIVMKALRKETVERYRSAEEMRDDITRFLEGRPVLAPPVPSVTGRGKASTPFEPPADEKSIAVLPLKILDPQAGLDTGDEFLGVGLADALITRLGALRRFTVRPTSTVLRYGRNGADPVAAGRELGVSYVVDGHVRRGAGRVRVTVQLLDVRDGTTLWGGQFDEPFTDVLVLEDAISSQVAEALVPHLTGAERRQLAKRGTDNSDAFEAYLRGRYHWNTFTEEGFAKAINCYYQAVAHDPDYALAYTGIADYYNWLGVYVILPFRETSAAAKEAASKAVELDPELAEGFAALGFATLTHDFDWGAAEAQLRRALELNPTYATAHSWYGFQLAMEGRFDESVAAMRRAVELDPLSPIHQHALSWCLYQARRYEEAAAAARKLIADEPNYGVGHFFLGWILRHVGQHEEALKASLKGVELLGRGPYVLGGLGATYAAAGRTAEAREVLRELHEIAEQRHVSPYHLALLHRHLGEHEEAFRQLERAFEMNDAWVVWLGVEPQFDALRSDSRFASLLRRTNNPLASRRAASLPGPTTGQKSVAVLPLRVLSMPGGDNNTGDEYLGVGLADALITRLSNLHRFVVRPTSSVLRYSGGEVDPFIAGRETGADFVVDGNVRRAGDVLRVTVQLLSVAEGATRWAGRFDEKITDVLALEDTLSEQVATALVPQLSGDEREQLAKRGTDNAQAFEAYLRGRFHWHSLTEEGFAKAIDNYRLAVELDPDYALAYAGIADYHIFVGIYGLQPFIECSAAAKEAALRAVELDPELAEGHAALGFALVTHDFDWEAAEREHRRALELNPNNPTARDWYSFLLLNQGRFDEALIEVERAHELDPLTPLVSLAVAWCHYHARRFDESVAVHRRVIDAEPRFAYGRLMYSWALRRAGRRGEAVEQAERATQIGGESQLYLTGLAAAYAEAGRAEDARATLERLRVMSETRYVSPYLLATVHVFLGEHERALALVEEAVRIRDAWVMWLAVEPQFDALRSDPHFRELVQRTNNPAATRHAESLAAGGAAEEEKSIAVLPLKILGGRGAESGDEYLSIGLADALITRLSNVRRFVTRPTSSVLRYRGEAGADPVAAGRELNVDYVLDGNIRRAGESIRVTAQLLSVAEGATLWGGHFDERFTDVLALEDSLSEQVAAALVPQLTNEERQKLQKRGTDNPEAFEAYMRGRHHWNTFTEEGFAKALVCYNQAVALAPDYALAYTGIADYYNWLGVYAVLPFAETSAAAKEAAL